MSNAKFLKYRSNDADACKGFFLHTETREDGGGKGESQRYQDRYFLFRGITFVALCGEYELQHSKTIRTHAKIYTYPFSVEENGAEAECTDRGADIPYPSLIASSMREGGT